MTFRAAEDAAAAKQKVNYDARALLGIDASAGALLRNEQATAGGSETIDDRSSSPFDCSIDLTSPLMFLGHRSTTPVTYEGVADEELLSLTTARSMGKVLGNFDLGTALRTSYGLNSESVVEHLVPTTLLQVNVDPVA